jgi:tetratricopeptide (TPR) repeat protein
VKRRWRVPPPLLRDADAPGPEGLLILNEVHGELGLVLWRSLRSVLLWAETDAPSRLRLFDEGAADRRQVEILSTVPADARPLREALEDLLPILDKPERADPEFAGIACTRIAAWADSQGAPQTALEFLQAGALCCPANPSFALAVGRSARDLAQYARAESWLYRAIGLSRQSRDWNCYIRSYLQHGTMLFRRGAIPAARRSIVKALRRSRRQGYRQGEAWALHDLFVLEGNGGDPTRALGYAREALEVLGPNHANLPRLAHDIAYFWLEQGEYRHALPVFLATLETIVPVARPAVLGSVSRAAAGVGDPSVFEWARDEIVQYGPGPGVAEAWVDIARGALALNRFEEARHAAGLAEATARARKEGRIIFLSESIMEQIQAEKRAADSLAASRSAAAPSQENDHLARELLRSLQLHSPSEAETAVSAVGDRG